MKAQNNTMQRCDLSFFRNSFFLLTFFLFCCQRFYYGFFWVRIAIHTEFQESNHNWMSVDIKKLPLTNCKTCFLINFELQSQYFSRNISIPRKKNNVIELHCKIVWYWNCDWKYSIKVDVHSMQNFYLNFVWDLCIAFCDTRYSLEAEFNLRIEINDKFLQREVSIWWTFQWKAK